MHFDLEALIDAIADRVAAKLEPRLVAAPLPTPDEIGSTRVAAGWIGLTPSAFKSLAHNHDELAALALRAGRARRWRRSDLVRWAEQHRSRPAPRLRALGGGK